MQRLLVVQNTQTLTYSIFMEVRLLGEPDGGGWVRLNRRPINSPEAADAFQTSLIANELRGYEADREANHVGQPMDGRRILR